MLGRMASPAQPRALPADLAEWKQVDRTAPLWAIAHYRGGGVCSDNDGSGKDVGATGMTAEFGLASGGVRARMLSRSEPWKELMGVPELAGRVRSREFSVGVWELSIDGKPEAANMAAFALMGMLGLWYYSEPWRAAMKVFTCSCRPFAPQLIDSPPAQPGTAIAG